MDLRFLGFSAASPPSEEVTGAALSTWLPDGPERHAEWDAQLSVQGAEASQCRAPCQPLGLCLSSATRFHQSRNGDSWLHGGRGVREHHAALSPCVSSESHQHSGEGVRSCKTGAPLKQPLYAHNTMLDESLSSPCPDLLTPKAEEQAPPTAPG